jgi:tetratricopeptide (TPR) repeat protein
MLGKLEEAMGLLEQYREAHPDDEREADVCLHIGDVHERAGRDTDAEKWYKRGLMAPTNTEQTIELCYRLGMARERQGNNEGALRAYAGALKEDDKSNPYRLSAVARCAALHEQNGNYKRAIVAYRDLIEHASDPEIVVAAKERASELENLGQ